MGRKLEGFRSTELSDAEKPEVLRAYLKRWKAEVGVFFDGVSADSPDEDVARIAPAALGCKPMLGCSHDLLDPVAQVHLQALSLLVCGERLTCRRVPTIFAGLDLRAAL